MSEDQAVRSRKPGRSFFRINVKTMMILVATSSLVIWLARIIWEDSTTQSHFIRVLQSGNTADRREAARQLSATPRPGEADKVVGALILGLRDEDAEVRTASANSLGSDRPAIARGMEDQPRRAENQPATRQHDVPCTDRPLEGPQRRRQDRSPHGPGCHPLPHDPEDQRVMPERLCLGLDPSDETVAPRAAHCSGQDPQ